MGCAKKAPPVPWESIVPKRIVDLEATPREGRLLLEWTPPRENTDKSALTDLASLQILRSEGVLTGEECKGCGEKTKVVYEMKWDSKEEGKKAIKEKKVSKLKFGEPEKDESKKKRMAVLFEDQEIKKVYVYQAVSVNRRGHPSAPSNPVTVYWDNPPPAPGMLKAERGDKKADLSWDPVEGATGYNIYRRLEEEEFPIQPLNRGPLAITQYSDLNVENEKRYIYSVRSVRRVVKTDIEGKGSPDISVIPTDLTPPSSPTGLVAIPLKIGMELNWKKNQELDLLGYYIYRRKAEEKEFKRLNDSPLTTETYLDKDVILEQDYEYSVTAVDNSAQKNESLRSEEARVKYLY